MKEVIVPIIGYEEKYLISNKGYVFSIVRNKKLANRKSGDHYVQIKLCKNGVKYFYLHRLLAIHFIPNPTLKPNINHIDGNAENNNLSNLEWCDVAYNNKHAWSIGVRLFQHSKILDLSSGIIYDSITDISNQKNKTYRTMLRIITKKEPQNYCRFF